MRPVSRSRERTKVLLVAARLHVRDDGLDGTVTERLERQDAKRFLDLDAELLDPEEEDGEGSGRRDRRPVVPRAAHRLPHRQWHEHHEARDEAPGMARVHERDG